MNKKLLIILGLVIIAVVVNFIRIPRGSFPATPSAQKSLVDQSKILDGGPGKDGIPSIDHPQFTSVKEAKNHFKDSDLALVVNLENQVKAYPILIMNWHEIVNDRIGQTPIVVTYCPLCGSGLTYKRVLDGQEVQFGVSGKLYNSDLLMYDRKTDSLWYQIEGQAIQGPLTGQKLDPINTNLIDFKTLEKSYPTAQVLSVNTGFARDYSRSPYGDYDSSAQTYFPVEHQSDKLFAKDRVVGVEVNGQFKAYRFDSLKQKGEIKDSLGGESLDLKMDERGMLSVTDATGSDLHFANTFWFAWAAAHPETAVYQ